MKAAPLEKAPPAKTVLIVDDHPFVCLGLKEALAGEPGLQVCGIAGSAEEALAAVEKLWPDVAVVDLNLPGKSGLELIKDLASLRADLPVIVLSMHEEEVYAERCLRAGGRGYVMKSESPEKLIEAIRHVLAGGVHVSAQTSSRIIEALAGRRTREKQTPIGQLSDREFELFRWIGRGFTTHEIAARLHISTKTVETHRMHIKAKLGMATAAELIAYAARWVAAGN
jgi:DNA-binding NarL/FixJ family response regulator